MNVEHTPVLVEETMDWLAIKPGGLYVDATVGLGGHAIEIVRRLGAGGRLVGLDRDAEALEIARGRLAEFGDKVTLVHANFSQIGEVFAERRLPPADGVLADLGVSSMQLDLGERGFSFARARPLDMRMDRDMEETAADIVNTVEEKALADLLYQLGEERDSRRIARTIVRASHTGHRTPGNGCGRGPKSKGKAEAASRDKNVSGAADCGESRDGGTRAVSF